MRHREVVDRHKAPGDIGCASDGTAGRRMDAVIVTRREIEDGSTARPRALVPPGHWPTGRRGHR